MDPNMMMQMMQGGIQAYSWPASCDGCRGRIKGFRYKCLTRNNYDFCQNCFVKRDSLGMKEHNWSQMQHPSIPAVTITEKVEKHRWPASCDGCRNTICGIRFKCITRKNYDFCEDCFEIRGSKGMSNHNWTKMINPQLSETINDQEEVPVEVKEVEKHRWPASCDGCRNTIIGLRFKCTTERNFDFCDDCFRQREQKGMANHDWLMMTNPSVPDVQVNERSGNSEQEKKKDMKDKYRWPASCDGCRNTIIGVRFKCLTQQNFDFCENCFSDRHSKGMSNHNWKKMIDPKSPEETLNDREEEIAKPKVNHGASCDGCRNSITGIRFKCTTERNFDFCEDCFANRNTKGMEGHNWEMMEERGKVKDIITERKVPEPSVPSVNPMMMMMQQQQQQMMQQNPMFAQMLQQQSQQNPMAQMVMQQQQAQVQQNPMVQMMQQQQQNPMFAQMMENQKQEKQMAQVSDDFKDIVSTIQNLVNFAKKIEKEKSYRGECRMGYNHYLPKIGYPSEWLDLKDGKEYLRCSELSSKIVEFMEQKESESGKKFYPEHDKTKEELRFLAKDCIVKHAKTAVKGLLSGLWDESKKKHYYGQLARFPGAREYVKRRIEEMKYSAFENEMWKIGTKSDSAKRFVLPESLPKMEGPAFQDSWEDYRDPCEMIRPADPSLPIRPGKIVEDSLNRMVWTDFRKRHTSKIVFSSSPISVNEDKDTNLSQSFVFGKDEIHGRAIWAHAIRHLAIGRDIRTGELVYPALQFKNKSHFSREDFFAEFYFHLFVNGKKIVIKGSPFGEIMTMDQRGDQDRGTNFYKFTQSCRLYVSLMGNSEWDIFDDFKSRAQKFNSVFRTLPKGKHRIRIEMSYRLKILGESLDADTPLVPIRDTLRSHPIASGEFELVIPKKGIPLPNPFPRYSCTVSNGQSIVKRAAEILRGSREWGQRGDRKEELIYCIGEGDLYPLYGEYWCQKRQERVRFIKQYGLEIRAAFYRNPQNGWDHEHIRIFKLAAYTPETDKVNQVKKMPPMLLRFGVGSSQDVECDYVPEEMWKMNKEVKRCTREMADYYIDLKPEDLKRIGREF